MSDSKQSSSATADPSTTGAESSRKEIYRYRADFPIYSVDWSWRKEFPYRLAFTSLIEGLNNRITLIQLDEPSRTLKAFATVEHPFPPTKVMWMPYHNSDKPDLFATTGDFLRIWELKGGSVISKSVLNSVCALFTELSCSSIFFILFLHMHSFFSKPLEAQQMHHSLHSIGIFPIQTLSVLPVLIPPVLCGISIVNAHSHSSLPMIKKYLILPSLQVPVFSLLSEQMVPSVSSTFGLFSWFSL